MVSSNQPHPLRGGGLIDRAYDGLEAERITELATDGKPAVGTDAASHFFCV